MGLFGGVAVAGKPNIVRPSRKNSSKCESQVNVVWDKPIQDLTKLLYEERNANISEKYNLEFADTIAST